MLKKSQLRSITVLAASSARLYDCLAPQGLPPKSRRKEETMDSMTAKAMNKMMAGIVYTTNV